MNSFDIFTLWQKGSLALSEREGDKSQDPVDFFKPRIRKNSIGLKINIFTYLLAQMAGIMLSSYDISIFLNNPVMLLVIILFIAIFSAGFIYGITLLFKLNRFEYDNRDLITSIKCRIRFYKIDFEVWLWLSSATVVLLPLAIVFIPDSVDGTYVINNVTKFIVWESAIFFGIYLLNKLSVYRLISDLKAYYSDMLEDSRLRTESRESIFRKYRTVIIAFFVILMLILIFVAFKGLTAYNSFR